MRKELLSILFICLIIKNSHAQAWEQKADFPGDGRSSVVSFSFPDYGFIGTGYDGEDFRRSFYAYDPYNDLWTQTESLGGIAGEGLERNVAAAFTIGNKGYIGTGQSGDPFLNDFWEYNYLTNIWALKASVGGVDRRCAVGFSVNGKGYIGLGQDESGYKNDLWEYDTLSNTWTQKADFTGTPRRLAIAFVIGAKAYVGTGDDGGFAKDFYEYNPISNSWFLRNDFDGSPRYGAAGFALNGKGYLACGYDTTLANVTDFWEYDPSADSWTQMPDFPGGARANLTAFVVDTLAFVGMGYDDTSFRYDIWLWGDTTNIIHEDTTDTNISVINIYTGIDIGIFPNPVINESTIHIQSDIYFENAETRVYDLAGNDVTNSCIIDPVSNTGRDITYRLNKYHLPPGVYQFVFVANKKIATEKFIVF
ncbi:MAG: kelch repeat-containing protein [Chitinophagales bacterium]